MATDVNLIRVRVRVIVENHSITGLELLEHYNDQGSAADALPEKIIEEQRIDVYAISGGTASSNVIDYLDYLEIDCGCKISTRNLRLSIIRAFYAYVAAMKPTLVPYLAEVQKVPKKKLGEPEIIDYISEKGIQVILEQPLVTTKKGLRD